MSVVTPDRTTSITGARELERPWLMHIEVEDDGLRPSLERGRRVLVDCNDRLLVDGGLYAVRHDDDMRLWLFQEGFAGLGQMVNGVPIGTLSSIDGAMRWRGPLRFDEIAVVGRVVDPADCASEEIDPICRLDWERRALSERLQAACSVWDDAEGSVRPQPALGASDPVADLRQRALALLEQRQARERFERALRVDALVTRIIYLEGRMAEEAPVSIDGVRAKLELLWQQHYAPFPEDQDDLTARVIRSSIDALAALGRENGTVTEAK